jgi:hypothetical protein
MIRVPRPHRPVWHVWTAATGFAVAAVFCAPLAFEANSLLKASEDPVAISGRALSRAFDGKVATAEIESALKADDADLAKSFVELADDRHVELSSDLRKRVDDAVKQANSAAAAANSFARGLITGEPADAVGLAGTAVGDLFVFGDIRDAVREGSRYASGENYDQLVLGLACVGLAITAGTYATIGLGAPARIGLSAVKAARRTGKITGSMASWIGRSLRETVDWAALKRVGGSLAEPVVAVRAAREAVKVDKAGGLVQLVSDVGKVQTKAGTRAALDSLKIANNPAEVARVAKLAEKQGGKTRAILKTLGRGAILLSISSFNLAMWILGAIATVFGFVSSAKAGVERATERHLARKRARQQARYAMMLGVKAGAKA